MLNVKYIHLRRWALWGNLWTRSVLSTLSKHHIIILFNQTQHQTLNIEFTQNVLQKLRWNGTKLILISWHLLSEVEFVPLPCMLHCIGPVDLFLHKKKEKKSQRNFSVQSAHTPLHFRLKCNVIHVSPRFSIWAKKKIPSSRLTFIIGLRCVGWGAAAGGREM